MRIYILAAVAAAGIGLGGTFGASAVPMNGNLVGGTAPAPELHKIYTTIDTRPILPASLPSWLLRWLLRWLQPWLLRWLLPSLLANAGSESYRVWRRTGPAHLPALRRGFFFCALSSLLVSARTAEPQTRCPLWVKSRHSHRKKSCPLYPQSGHSATNTNFR